MAGSVKKISCFLINGFLRSDRSLYVWANLLMKNAKRRKLFVLTVSSPAVESLTVALLQDPGSILLVLRDIAPVADTGGAVVRRALSAVALELLRCQQPRTVERSKLWNTMKPPGGYKGSALLKTQRQGMASIECWVRWH
jgi:hypothetical protein